jgi:RNA polymerase sigma-70 factor (ECF subfamily)
MTSMALLDRARRGDNDAFAQLTDPYRREIQTHCYRMLGSLQDAEDALHDTLLGAWQGLAGFEARASVRTWLYRVATNRCLNARRAAARRAAQGWPLPDVDPIAPSRLGEVMWLEPYPDALFDGSPDQLGPEARYEAREAISLAFVTALQLLPARQRAVLILRDVLGFHAVEVAEMLETTVESVTSALKRARGTLKKRMAPTADHAPPPRPNSAEEQALVARLAYAYETGDVDRLVELLTDDVVVAMPPVPFEYCGQALAREFHTAVSFRGGRTWTVLPTRANGQPAFGAYLRLPGNGPQPTVGLIVMTLAGQRVSAITRFDPAVLPSFGLPVTLAG